MTARIQLTTLWAAPRILSWSAKVRSWEPPIEWEIRADFPLPEVLRFKDTEAFLRVEFLWVLCAENEEEIVAGTLKPNRPSPSTGVIHLAHQRFEFQEKLMWGPGVRAVFTWVMKEWEKGMGESGSTTPELEWISIFFSSSTHQPAKEKTRKSLQHLGWQGEKLPQFFKRR